MLLGRKKNTCSGEMNRFERRSKDSQLLRVHSEMTHECHLNVLLTVVVLFAILTENCLSSLGGIKSKHSEGGRLIGSTVALRRNSFEFIEHARNEATILALKTRFLFKGNTRLFPFRGVC